MCVNSNRAGAGGLVGYAGNGCEAYDMHVDAAEGCEVTIGGSSVSMVGGIVGSMQPAESKYSSCEAIFSNCEINGINLAADEYAGGLYGGAHNNDWSPYSIKVVNCRVTGNSSNPNSITAVSYAGGLIGDAYIVSVAEEGHANVEVSDTIVSHYIISTTGNNTAAGGFIGYADAYVGLEKNGDLEEYANNSVICYIHDSSVENCQIAVNGNYGGGALGKIIKHNSNKVLGYNNKLDNVTSTSSSMGAWIGWVDTSDSTTSIQFTGVGIYGNGFTKNVGNNVTLSNASFVFAAYDEDMLTANPGVSGLNKGTTVDMPRYPYVNINPQSSMGTGEVISGDGAVLYSNDVPGFTGTGKNTMAAKIYADISDSNNTRRYTTFNDAAVYNGNGIDHYLTKTKADTGDKISTWKTETDKQLSGVTDFSMIVIANEDDVETTALINRYIQLVTNTATNYWESSPYYSIVPKACVYDSTSGKFEVTEGAASIAYTVGQSNAFSVNRAGADSLAQNKFTLIDVQFKDPLNTSNIAYHLYVPVYVKRSISAVFASTALSGTDVLASTYTPNLTTNYRLVENLDNWITAYISYQYSTDDINAILDSGMLDWNSSKQVVLNFSPNATGTALPATSKFVLIDPNGDVDKAYYAVGADLGENTFPLSAFKKLDGTGTAFTEQKFNDLLDGFVTAVEETGYYDKVTSSNKPYDIKIGDDYYSYVADKTGSWNLTASEVFKEEYYISMMVPSDDNGYTYLFDIEAPKTLAGKMVTYVTNRNYADILLGDLFEQQWTTHTVRTTTEEDVISEGNNTITVDVTSTVKLKSTDKIKRGVYADYLNTSSLYHADVVTFTRHDISGADNTINGGTTIVSSGSVNNTSVTTVSSLVGSNVLVKTGNIRQQVTENARNENYTGATITQSISVTFLNFEDEFPERPSDSDNYGVDVSVSSNISYNAEGLSYSGKKIPYDFGTRYYVEKANSATLKYKANKELDEYDSVGSASHNNSRLGNNGQNRFLTCMWPEDDDGMPISATAAYNASRVANIETAKTIVYTLSLYKKTDTVDGEGNITKVSYEQVDIDTYLKNVEVHGGGDTPLVKNAVSSTSKEYVYSELISAANKDENVFTLGTQFEVVTGGSFNDYANYRVMLEVHLLSEGGATISNSTVKDYIVYTNAKIYPEVIQLSP